MKQSELQPGRSRADHAFYVLVVGEPDAPTALGVRVTSIS